MNTTIIIIVFVVLVLIGVGLVLPRKIGKSGEDKSGEDKSSKDSQSIQESKKSGKAKDFFEKAVSKATQISEKNQLLLPPKIFLGRKKELNHILSTRTEKTQIISLSGPSGIGKTAVASNICLVLLPNFSDGQYYFDLKGNKAKPLKPEQIMALVIQKCRPSEKIPIEPRDIEKKYLSIIKKKRLLLFLDNVSNASQIKNLIHSSSCIFVITSGEPVTLPNIISQKLEGMDEEDANQLLTQIAFRSVDFTDDFLNKYFRFVSKKITKYCNNVPLAIVLSAKFLDANFLLPTDMQMDPNKYVNDLSEECNKLGQTTGLGPKESLLAVIHVVYKTLPKTHTRMLGKLLVFPESFTDKAEAFICEDQDSNILSKLADQTLVNHDVIKDRYYWHDEIRKFVESRSSESDRPLAAMRHASYYLTQLIAANEEFFKGENGIVNGLKKFDLEWENIKVGAAWARANSSKDNDFSKVCNGYAESGSKMLAMRQSPTECIRWMEAGLNAARQLDDMDAEKNHLLNLGTMHNELKKYDRAIAFLEQAQTLAEEQADSETERSAHHLLGLANLGDDNVSGAITHFQAGLELARQNKDLEGEQELLEKLGWACQKADDQTSSVEFYIEALELAKNNKDNNRQGKIIGKLGEVYSNMEYFDKAMNLYQEGLDLARKTKDKAGEEQLLASIGDSHMKSGDAKNADFFYKQALVLAKENKNRKSEATLLKRLGDASTKTKELQLAASYYQDAAGIFKKESDYISAGESYWAQSQILANAENKEPAIEAAKSALRIFKTNQHPKTGAVRKQLESWEKDAQSQQG